MTHIPEPPRKLHADRLGDAALRPDRPERLNAAGDDVRDLPRHPAEPDRVPTGEPARTR